MPLAPGHIYLTGKAVLNNRRPVIELSHIDVWHGQVFGLNSTQNIFAHFLVHSSTADLDESNNTYNIAAKVRCILDTCLDNINVTLHILDHRIRTTLVHSSLLLAIPILPN